MSFKNFCLAFITLWFFLSWNFSWFGTEFRDTRNIIKSDGKGYYHYLPYVFFEKNSISQEHPFLVKTSNGKKINKYTSGTALLQLPFFLGAYFYAYLFDHKMDGYSTPFQIAVSIAALFWFLVGLYYVFKNLKDHLNLPPNRALLFTSLLPLATSLLYYLIILPSFSHIYSFSILSIWTFYTLNYLEKRNWRDLLILSALLGIIFLIRPVNILILLFLPFLTHLKKRRLSDLLPERKDLTKTLLLSALLILLPVMMQFYFWFLQSGEWFVWSYKGEGFLFSEFHWHEFLLGFKKGFFIYTPFFLLLIPSLFFLFKKDRSLSLYFSVAFLIITWIFSSWWNWYYSDGFGMRPMNDLYDLLLLPIALIHRKSPSIRKTFLFSLPLIYLNLIFSWQFYQGIIHPNDMTAKKFFKVFLHTENEYRDYLGGNNDIRPFAPKGFDTLLLTNDKNTIEIKQGEEFFYGKDLILEEKHKQYQFLFIEIESNKKINDEQQGKGLLFTLHGLRNDSTITYQTFRFKKEKYQTPNVWLHEQHAVIIPNLYEPGDKLGLYFWNKEKENFELKDISICVTAPKPY